MTDADTSAMLGEEEEVPTKQVPVKEVPVVHDEGLFTHSTGDTYNGFFEAKKRDHIVKMHGHGVYKTAEGDFYEGTWDNDKLGGGEDVMITFADTSIYNGRFKDWYYSGVGKYTFPDKSTLICNFVENCPVGHMTLLDPNNHTWLGKADQGFGWFQPVNHFYSMLGKNSEVVKIKHRRKSDDTSMGITTSGI